MQAIISDIHGNLPAPKVVLRDIHRKGIARIICLSDVVGYGPHPVRCVDIVRKRCEVTVCGDHDFGATAIALGFEESARASLEWTRERATSRSTARRSGFIELNTTSNEWWPT